jgi:hypothetical protein
MQEMFLQLSATDAAFSAVVTPSTGADATAFNWTYAKSKSAF